MPLASLLDLQLKRAIADAEALPADASVYDKKLAQTRLSTINKSLQRRHDKKVLHLSQRNTKLKQDVARLTSELATAQQEIARLNATPAPQPMSDIAIALAAYRKSEGAA